VAVKTTRQAYQESQATFAQRVGLSAMTVSKFERGETVPRDPAVLQSLSDAAVAVGLETEAEQFVTACIEAVNRMYPGPLVAAVQPMSLSIAFQTLPEWRLLIITLFAARYDSDVAKAISSAGGPVRAIVDQVLQDADVSKGIGPDFFRKLEVRIKTLMDAQAIPRTIQEER
jgi:hypothetical protein